MLGVSEIQLHEGEPSFVASLTDIFHFITKITFQNNMAMSILYPSSQFNYGGVPGQESKLFYLPGKLFYSDTDAAAAGAAAGAVAAASAVCIYYVFIGGGSASRPPICT